MGAQQYASNFNFELNESWWWVAARSLTDAKFPQISFVLGLIPAATMISRGFVTDESETIQQSATGMTVKFKL